MTAKAAATLCFCIGASLYVAGCGRYADFTLPVLPGAATAVAPVLHFEPQPVQSPGEWDRQDVLNPSVVWFHSKFHNLYSGFDGHAWHTGLATSADGVKWQSHGKVLSPDAATWEGSYIAANGSALVVGEELWYWYQAGDRESPRIGLARSADGRTWRKEQRPVVGLGPYMSWDEHAVADPYVVRKDGWFYLYYLGQNRARQQQLGLARSRDGVMWTKLRSNPIVSIPLAGSGSPAESGLGEPAMWERGGAYWMLYTGRDARENRTLALMRSGDGVQWTAVGAALKGGQPWNAKVLCDATVLGDRFWFGGGDIASPDENLHGRIGVGALR